MRPRLARAQPTVTMGLAWDVTNGVNIDLDASCILLDANLRQVDVVFYGARVVTRCTRCRISDAARPVLAGESDREQMMLLQTCGARTKIYAANAPKSFGRSPLLPAQRLVIEYRHD